jgi:hypothetical protein
MRSPLPRFLQLGPEARQVSETGSAKLFGKVVVMIERALHVEIGDGEGQQAFALHFDDYLIGESLGHGDIPFSG